MSGHKESEFRLQHEREERVNLIRSLSACAAGIESLRGRIKHSLEAASAGLRATFSVEVRRAESWAVDAPAASHPDEEGPLPTLRKLSGSLEEVREQGRRALEELILVMTASAGAMGKRMSRGIAEAEARFFERKDLIESWYGKERVEGCTGAIARMRRLLEEEQYSQLEPVLARLSQEISEMTISAESQEQKHQKRLYLLKALRQVCAEMGFHELGEARWEQPGQRGSAILYSVDTLDRGRIAFCLTLDGIHSDSDVSSSACFDEFGTISRYLDEEFGIHTDFRVSGEPPPPALRRKGEKDLPEGARKSVQL